MTIVPVYNMLILPEAAMFMKNDLFQSVAGRLPKKNEKVLLVPLKEEVSRNKICTNYMHELAVTGVIVNENINGFVHIITIDRTVINSTEVTEDKDIKINYTAAPETDDLAPDDENTLFEVVNKNFLDFASGQEWGDVAKYLNGFADNLNSMISILDPFLELSPEQRYALLAENSRRKRAKAIEQYVGEFVEMTKLTDHAMEINKDNYQKQLRESAIRNHMEYLQGELDKLHPDELSELQKLELAVMDSDMNEEARKEAEKVISRMKNEGQQTQEYAMLYDWLEMLVHLPWKKKAPEMIDLKEARMVLDEEHYGLKKVKERIIQQIAVLDLKGQQSGSILCFVGAPGTGKTSIGKSIAKALHREYVRISLGGVRDEAEIRGHRRTYVGAMPGRIMNGIYKAGASDPVVILDEIDKLSSNFKGDPANALLEVLDPEQNNTFTDHYLNVPYDLSDVLFICTANSLDTIPKPLLDRMEVVYYSGYTETEKFHIAVNYLLAKAEAQTGIPKGHIHISDECMRAIITDYTAESGVRGLKRQLDTLCRAAAVKMVEGNLHELFIEKQQLHEYLDMYPIRHKVIAEKSQAGVVTGLAWTSSGGEILYIEALFIKGTGKLVITGQLGDVMKESVQIAVSLIRYMYPDRASQFEKNDLHIHVPDGAVPKDGPSAGITIAAAVASLVTGKAIDPETAMSGEISLRGIISAVGGLPEKLIAAKRSGVKTVLLPSGNADQLNDIDDEITQGLSIRTVSGVEEALKLIGLK